MQLTQTHFIEASERLYPVTGSTKIVKTTSSKGFQQFFYREVQLYTLDLSCNQLTNLPKEIYHETHQFFLTERSLYALVADTRAENTDFYHWLDVVELLSNNSPSLTIIY